ncbi:MAG: Fe-S protein assembly co-chaperone HscB [Hydrogenophaga sp.]|nr:Fe-S protein assembly co-chaperone HscB [Hydrogenophaga sp.]
MNLQSNDFEIFDLSPRFELDRATLDERWKSLQREVHPDRHAAADAQTQRQAMQWSVRINEAYQRLKDPLKRAAYLCEMNGAPVEFLMQQMQWREELEDASTLDALERMADEVAATRRNLLKDLATTADTDKNWPAVAQQVRALMFIERFASDVENRMEVLGQ